ncbi:MAG: type pilus assembly protein PilA [Acidimicrobiaceae bacterium]|jgi:type IV pilus assembly protein PilA|nr:type pilus assembly protein PilA [Acidimicrobiaceae bacterium]
MLEKLRARRQSEEGFTLIELMVVVLIIAILLAIAIPTFLGARGKAQDRAAQSNLRNALTAEKTFYTDNQAYSSNAASDIKPIEPNLTFGATPAVGIVLSQPAADTSTVCLTKTSASGTVFSIWESASNGTFYGKADLSTCPAGTSAGPTGQSGFKTTGF